MAWAKIIKDPHVLFVGGNGKKTFGITVEALCSPAESKSRGYQHSWKINEYSFFKTDSNEFMDLFGIDQTEYDRIHELFRSLSAREACDALSI